MDSVTFISHAAQARLRTVLETVSSIAQHRLDSCKDEEWYEPSADVRSQLRFFEQLERMEKQRKDEQEREILLKAAKSRARLEDPEQARLKQKAKEMQQHELAQTRQREANLTALAAIGPRKKRKMDSAWATASGSEGIATILWTSGRAAPATAAALLQEYNPILSGGGDIEEKGIVLPELSCRTAAEATPAGLPPKLRRQSGRRRSCPAAAKALAAVRQCTLGAELRPKLSGCSGGCTLGAELPPKLAGPAGVGLGGSPAAPAR
ncbi:unnamed protein product [Boreogadus saida]